MSLELLFFTCRKRFLRKLEWLLYSKFIFFVKFTYWKRCKMVSVYLLNYKLVLFLMMETWEHWWLVRFCFVFHNYCFCLQSIYILFFAEGDIDDSLDFVFLLIIMFFLTQHFFLFDDGDTETLMSGEIFCF